MGGESTKVNTGMCMANRLEVGMVLSHVVKSGGVLPWAPVFVWFVVTVGPSIPCHQCHVIPARAYVVDRTRQSRSDRSENRSSC